MKTKKNVIDKFKSFFGKLDGTEQRHLYDVLSLLRGPDSGRNENVKEQVTMRIRFLLGVDGNVFPSSSILGHARMTRPAVSQNPIVPIEVNQIISNFDNYHYIEHVRDAMATLYELGLAKDLDQIMFQSSDIRIQTSISPRQKKGRLKLLYVFSGSQNIQSYRGQNQITRVSDDTEVASHRENRWNKCAHLLQNKVGANRSNVESNDFTSGKCWENR
jgi:hypothetical protein